MLIDTNVSFGHWPFAWLPQRSLAELEDHLGKHDIAKALVSPLDTVFLPDPDCENRALLTAVRNSQRLSVVPVINLALPDWRENLDAYRSLHPLKAVKLYPNFHNYPLSSRRCSELVAHLTEHAIRLIVNVRLVDERHQYFGLKIKAVSTQQIAAFARRHPDFDFLCAGLYLPEIVELSEQCSNFLTDMAFADWHDLINRLLKHLPPDRLVFGSHTPLMTTQANTYKLAAAPISAELKQQIGYENARRFFQL